MSVTDITALTYVFAVMKTFIKKSQCGRDVDLCLHFTFTFKLYIFGEDILGIVNKFLIDISVSEFFSPLNIDNNPKNTHIDLSELY